MDLSVKCKKEKKNWEEQKAQEKHSRNSFGFKTEQTLDAKIVIHTRK